MSIFFVLFLILRFLWSLGFCFVLFLVSLGGYKQIMGSFYANFLNCNKPKAILFL